MAFRSTFLVVFPETVNRSELNSTGKIIMPPSAITRLRNESLMQFLIKNPVTQKSMGAGVEEFTAEEPSCVIPKWMCEYLGLTENDKVTIQFQRFPAITELTFQPLDEATAQKLNETKVIMEYTLRQYPVLTQGSTLEINFVNNIFLLKVLFTKPERIVNTLHSDAILNFARPLMSFDHQWGEEEDTENSRPKTANDNQFIGSARTIRGKKPPPQ